MKRIFLIMLVLVMCGCAKSEECERYIQYGDVACADMMGYFDCACMANNWSEMKKVCK